MPTRKNKKKLKGKRDVTDVTCDNGTEKEGFGRLEALTILHEKTWYSTSREYQSWK